MSRMPANETVAPFARSADDNEREVPQALDVGLHARTEEHNLSQNPSHRGA